MKKFKNLLLVVLFFTATAIFSQTKITGKVVDSSNEPLPGASIVVKNTTKGTSTDFDGNFTIIANSNDGVIVISFVGYKTKEISFSSSRKDLGNVQLTEDSSVLDEIVVTATSFAIDRKTPVAISTIKGAEIERKLGTQEFPEILKSTPGVYATKQGGGFGDSRISLRGFNSENVAVLINGVPVNDMENGIVYWSNWAGLSDVTAAMQVQRGLGAAKVAVPSIGGTINIVSKTTDITKGGSVTMTHANDGYKKIGATLSTGVMDNGLAATVSLARVSGQGYVDGTEFNGYNYFVSLSKELNEKHKLSLTTFGAPQRHGQRQNRSTISTIRNAESGIRFNPDWGYKNGQVTHIEDNFYHKSQTSLNHYWTISEKSNLSTAAYVSFGTGGGGGTAGSNRDLFNIRLGGNDQPVNLDNIVSINTVNGALGSEAILRASRNDHTWYGILSTFKSEISDNLDLVTGVDLRSYTGRHYREVTDLLGGQYFLDDSDINNPNAALKVGDKFSYNNDGKVGWLGLFAQLEYEKDNISAFLSTAASNTSYKRIDYFQYTPGNQETDKYNFFGYSAKGGVNYRLDETHNVFANVGYFEKAAGFDAVFQQFDNDHINENAENQKIFSAELGYGIRSEKFAANINIYRTEWNDRTFTRSIQGQNLNEDFTANLLGVNALHQGLEIDFTYRPSDKLSITGMASLGDWKWDNNLTDVDIFDENQNVVETINLPIKGLRVSDAAQTTAALGLNYKFWEDTSITFDYNYYDDMYARVFILDYVNTATIPTDTWKTPDYHLIDASLRHGTKIGDFNTTFTLRVNNIFDTEYISDAINGSTSTASDALVWFGAGRTFSLSAKIKF